MDNFVKLSKADVKLLNRLRIPQVQKLLLENYWQANPVTTNKYLVMNVFLMLTRPLIVAILASPFFLTNTLPFINMALVVLWIFNPLILSLHLFVAITSALMAANNQDEMMNRNFAVFLPGGNSFLVRAYSTLTWGAMFGLTASEGYLLTAGMIVLCWLGTWVLNKFCAGIVSRFLEERVNEIPNGRIARTITLRMSK